MSGTRAYASLVIGALGVVVCLVVPAVAWWTLPPVGAQAASTASSVRASVAGVQGRLVEVDEALGSMDTTLAAFRAEHDDDLEAVRAQRRRLREDLAPFVREIREDLLAVRDVALAIDNLLQALDLPFLGTAGRAGAERMEAIVERVPHYEPEAVLTFDLALPRQLVGEARAGVAAWRTSLDGLDSELRAIQARAPRLVTALCLVVTLLALWSLVGQVCLVRAGLRGPRRDRA